MDDKIQAFRQPLVTATGIILGFILNFASSFVKSETTLSDLASYIIAVCFIVGVVCLIVVLKLILAMDYPKENTEKYYQKILNLFIIGVSIAFLGVLIDMFSNFMTV